jgi:ribokinase
MGKVVVLGSINRDLVLSVEAHPRPGETVSGADLREFPGGKGANQAVAAQRAGAACALFGAVGDDGFGEAMQTFLNSEGIDLSHLRVVQGRPTGIALITVDRHGENAIIVSAGANAALGPGDLAGLVPAPGDLVVAQFEVPEPFIVAGFKRAHAAGAKTLLNPAPMRSLAPELLALTDLLILNETELESAGGGAPLGDETAVTEAAQKLAAGQRHVIVTLGAQGCLAVTPEGVIRLPAPLAVAVDTTGAGDCFVGVLAAGLAEGLAFPVALERACKAASISVTRAGAAQSMPFARELA